jgi:hypothetical protein
MGVVAAAFLSAPTFAVWCLAFLNAKPAWRKDDGAARGHGERQERDALGVGLGLG